MAVSPKVLQRVRDLVGLSASDRIEEARNAAYLACKMIREHGLSVVEGKGGGVGGSTTAGSERRRAPTQGDEAVIARARQEGTCMNCHLTYYYRARVVKAPGGWVHLNCWRHA